MSRIEGVGPTIIGSSDIDLRGWPRGIARYISYWYSALTQSFHISAIVKTRTQLEICEEKANAVRSINSLCFHLRILQGVVYNRRICPERFRPPEGQGTMRRDSYLRLIIKVISAHCIWRVMPNVVQLLPDVLAPRASERKVLGVPFRSQDSPFMEARPTAPQARLAWDKDLQARRDPSFYWNGVIQALEDLSRWLRMELIFFKKEIVYWDGLAHDRPLGRPAPAGAAASDGQHSEEDEDEASDATDTDEVVLEIAESGSSPRGTDAIGQAVAAQARASRRRGRVGYGVGRFGRSVGYGG